MSRTVASSSPSSSPVALVKPGQRFVFDGAHGSSDALLIARYHLASREQVPLLAVVCASAVDAQRLAQEIAYFAPNARIRVLPDWETLPYDTFSPHQDLVSERLATLHDLGEGRCDVLLVPVGGRSALNGIPQRHGVCGVSRLWRVIHVRPASVFAFGTYSHPTQPRCPMRSINARRWS